MISFTLTELLYIVLIIAVVVLTVYLVVVLTRLNTVLRDVQVVSKVAAKVGNAVDSWGSKAAAGVLGALHYFSQKADETKRSKK